MTQPINPYAPTSTQGLDERRKVWTDTDAPPVAFRATIDDDSWQGIRLAPPPPLTHLYWAAGASLVGTGIGATTLNWEPMSRWMTPLLLIGWSMFISGLGYCVVYWQRRRDATSTIQTDTQPWMRGAIQGQISSRQLILHSETVSIAIPREWTRKLQWYSGALQIEFGPLRIPAKPSERISIPIDVFDDGEGTAIPLVPLKLRQDTENMAKPRWRETIDALTQSYDPHPSHFDWHIELSDHLRWNDLEWTSKRKVLKRVVQFLIVVAITIYFVVRIVPGNWPVDLNAAIFPTVLVLAYLIMFYVPFIAGRSLLPLEGWIAGNHEGAEKAICLQGPRFVAIYRDRPSDYGRWTEHGLEIRPEPERLEFFVPARVFRPEQQQILAAAFNDSRAVPRDTADQQFWAGPMIPTVANPTP